MIGYRSAGPEDAALLSRLGAETFVETFGHLYAPKDLHAFLDAHSEEKWQAELADPELAVRLAEDGAGPAAYCKIGPPTLPLELAAPTQELRQLYVLSPWQGAGVAGALMDWAIAEARRRGAKQMILSVYIDNHRAWRFYGRYGFEEVGRYTFMVGDHEDDDRILRLTL